MLDRLRPHRFQLLVIQNRYGELLLTIRAKSFRQVLAFRFQAPFRDQQHQYQQRERRHRNHLSALKTIHRELLSSRDDESLSSRMSAFLDRASREGFRYLANIREVLIARNDLRVPLLNQSIDALEFHVQRARQIEDRQYRHAHRNAPWKSFPYLGV